MWSANYFHSLSLILSLDFVENPFAMTIFIRELIFPTFHAYNSEVIDNWCLYGSNNIDQCKINVNHIIISNFLKYRELHAITASGRQESNNVMAAPRLSRSRKSNPSFDNFNVRPQRRKKGSISDYNKELIN